MSFYSTLQGEVTYPTPKAYKDVVTQLQQAHWMDAEGYFIDETSNRVTKDAPNADPDTLTIAIPTSCYRNLSRFDFFQHGAQGIVVGTSTDGCFEGWVIENGNEESYDLAEWAKDNLEADNALAPQPDEAEYFQKLTDWQEAVQQEFLSGNGA